MSSNVRETLAECGHDVDAHGGTDHVLERTFDLQSWREAEDSRRLRDDLSDLLAERTVAPGRTESEHAGSDFPNYLVDLVDRPLESVRHGAWAVGAESM